MLKFVVNLSSIEQLEVLLGTAKALGLTPELGAVLDEEPTEPQRRRPKGRSTSQKSRRKPKRYGSGLRVRMGKKPKGPPRVIEVYQTLRQHFGGESFRKGDAKGVVSQKLNGLHATGHISKLMETGGMVPV